MYCLQEQWVLMYCKALLYCHWRRKSSRLPPFACRQEDSGWRWCCLKQCHRSNSTMLLIATVHPKRTNCLPIFGLITVYNSEWSSWKYWMGKMSLEAELNYRRWSPNRMIGFRGLWSYNKDSLYCSRDWV